jgi:hypothetical protein
MHHLHARSLYFLATTATLLALLTEWVARRTRHAADHLAIKRARLYIGHTHSLNRHEPPLTNPLNVR